MEGKCIHCGSPITSKGKLCVTCMNCKKMQVWEKNGETSYQMLIGKGEKSNGNDMQKWRS